MLDKDHHVDVIVVAAVYRVWARLIKLKLHEGRVVLFHMLYEVRAVDYHRETDDKSLHQVEEAHDTSDKKITVVLITLTEQEKEDGKDMKKQYEEE